MGRRKKAAKKVVKKKRPTVSKVFKCLFCNHEKSVTCSLDSKSMTGQLTCGVCSATYQTRIHSLTEPIDVFTEWLDDTVDAQAKVSKKIMSSSAAPTRNRANDEFDVTAGYEDADEIEDDEDD